MLAVLTLEAHRAGALVIGEDLGTVEPEVTDGLAERNMLGCSVLWFTRDYDAPGAPLLPPAELARGVGGHRLHPRPAHRARLPARRARAGPRRAGPARRRGRRAGEGRRPTAPSWSTCCGPRAWSPAAEPGEDQLVLAVHALLARARSRLALISPYDVVGETRQPNLPGTVDQYPNWRLPLPVSLEELQARPAGARGRPT